MPPIPLFDAHCDTLSRCARLPCAHLSGNRGQWDLDRLDHFEPKAQFFALWWDSKWPFCRRMLKRQVGIFHRECRREGERLAFCRTGREASDAFSQGKLAAFLSVEGGELLDCDLGCLERAWEQGVRMVNLTWNHANALSGSHKEEPERGLSHLGRTFVKRMGELGMLVDVSHLSDAGFWDVMEITKKPVVASHSNSRNVFFHTRNLTDEQFTAIIEQNGIVGLNGYTAFLGEKPVTQDTVIAHLEHFLSLGGEKTVALGGDWDGCDSLPEGYEGVWDWRQLWEELLRRNYPQALVEDLFFNNLMRTVNEVCTM